MSPAALLAHLTARGYTQVSHATTTHRETWQGTRIADSERPTAVSATRVTVYRSASSGQPGPRDRPRRRGSWRRDCAGRTAVDGPFRDFIPDFLMEIIDLVAEGEKAGRAFPCSGTHLGGVDGPSASRPAFPGC